MAQIDEVISSAEQNRWTSDASYLTEWGKPAYPDEKRDMSPDKMSLYSQFMNEPELLPIVDFLQHYLPNCLPYFRTTEQNFWALSIVTTYGPIFAVNGIQTLVDVYYEDGLVFRWCLTLPELHKAFGKTLERMSSDYPSLQYKTTNYSAGGPDQVFVYAFSAEDAIRLCHDKKFVEQIRAFTLRVLRKGGRRPGQFTYHSFPLVDKVVSMLSNVSQSTSNLVQVAKAQPSVTGFEGRESLHTLTDRKRDQSLVAEAKQRFKVQHGHLFCEVCNFDFTTVYGELGQEYIEAHHIHPISGFDPEGGITSIEDLRLVCSNCHKMIHRKNPILTVDALRQIVIQNRR